MRADDLRARVERRGDATVVRLHGVLDVDGCAALRAAVLACLAAEPCAIVLDVAGLRHDDDVALTVLPALAQHAAAWPGSPLALAAASPVLASALERMAVARRVPVYPTAEAALAALLTPPAALLTPPAPNEPAPGEPVSGEPAPGSAGPGPGAFTASSGGRVALERADRVRRGAGVHAPAEFTVRRIARAPGKGAEPDDPIGTRVGITLPPLPDATGAARHLVGRACTRWGFTRARDVAELVVTELVSNVLRHARTGMEVTAARDRGRIHIAVRDRSTELPRLGGRPAAADHTPADAHSRIVERASEHVFVPARRPEPGGPGEILREEGRGLLVVEALAKCWGCIPVPGGKVIWATITN